MVIKNPSLDKMTFICPFLHIDECYLPVIESARYEPDW
jgi:hypothetical protein